MSKIQDAELTLKRIETFVALHDDPNFSRENKSEASNCRKDIAKALGLSKEELFDRKKISVMTEKGIHLYRFAKDVLEAVKRLEIESKKDLTKPNSIAIGIAFDDMSDEIVKAGLELERADPNGPGVIFESGRYEELINNNSIDIVFSEKKLQGRLTPFARVECFDEVWLRFYGPASAKSDFPQSLHGKPFILPSSDEAYCEKVKQWFSDRDVSPLYKYIPYVQLNVLEKLIPIYRNASFSVRSEIDIKEIDQVLEVVQIDNILEAFEHTPTDKLHEELQKLWPETTEMDEDEFSEALDEALETGTYARKVPGVSRVFIGEGRDCLFYRSAILKQGVSTHADFFDRLISKIRKRRAHQRNIDLQKIVEQLKGSGKIPL